MKFFPLPLCFFLGLSLISCGTSDKKETPSLMSQKMAKRLTKPDMNRKSLYDKEMQASLNPTNKGTDWLGSKKYSAKKFGGTTEYTNTPNFKTDAYSVGKDKMSFHTPEFAFAGKDPSFADKSFNTTQSRFDQRSDRDANKAFGGATDVFRTSANRAALQSQEKNQRPKMIELDEKKSTPAYTEDQVRSLMGRD